MQPRRKPRTDYGTVILHWLLVAIILVLMATGLRFTAAESRYAWVGGLGTLFPPGNPWSVHIWSGLGLAMLAVAYPIYMWRAKLNRRIRIDRPRLASLKGRGRARRGTLNHLLTWSILLVLVLQLATGALLYAGTGGDVATLHLIGAITIAALSLAHVTGHWLYGGLAEVLRIFRPARLPQPLPTLTPAELLALYLEHMRGPRPAPPPPVPPQPGIPNGRGEPPPPPAPFRRGRHPSSLHAHPLMVAAGAAVAAGLAFSSLGHATRSTLAVAPLAVISAGADEPAELAGI